MPSCNAAAGDARVTGSPSIRIIPASGCSAPARILIRVDPHKPLTKVYKAYLRAGMGNEAVRGGSNYNEPVQIFSVGGGIKIYTGFNRNLVIVEVCVFPSEITSTQAKAFLNKIASGWKKDKEMS